MFLIVSGHLFVHYISRIHEAHPSSITVFFQYYFELIHYHVDLFILITGYFGVNRWGVGILKILFLCIFYAMIINVSYIVIYGGGGNFLEVIFPISHSPWWFMQDYFLLLLVAPLIERVIEGCSNRRFYLLLLIMAFIVIYLGCFKQFPEFSHDGYDLNNFIMVYLLGVWLRKDCGIIKYLRNNVKISIVVFILCCAFLYKWQPYAYIVQLRGYDSPVTYTMAICVFCIFLRIRIPSRFNKVILFLSSSIVSVYLVTDHYVFKDLTFQPFCNIYTSTGGFMKITFLCLCLLISFVLCVCFDKLRLYASNRVTPYVYKFITNKVVKCLS